MSDEKVIMPASDYKNICDKVREKTGSTELIKSGDMSTLIDNIQTGKEEQEKTVDITENGTTEILPDESKVLSKVEVNVNVPSDGSLAIGLIQRDLTEIDIPNNCTVIASRSFYCNYTVKKINLNKVNTIQDYAFFYSGLVEIDIPDTVTTILSCAFYGCKSLTSVKIGAGLSKLPLQCFRECNALREVTIPSNITYVEEQCFRYCSNLTTVYIPKSLTFIGANNIFGECYALEFITIEQGFNCQNLKLNSSTKYSVETIVSWAEALYDRTGLDPYTLIIGETNIAKLTDEQIAVFTNKNWTLA